MPEAVFPVSPAAKTLWNWYWPHKYGLGKTKLVSPPAQNVFEDWMQAGTTQERNLLMTGKPWSELLQAGIPWTVAAPVPSGAAPTTGTAAKTVATTPPPNVPSLSWSFPKLSPFYGLGKAGLYW